MPYTVDIEIYEPSEKAQARYCVHGMYDLTWTDSLDDAIEFLRDSLREGLERWGDES